MMLQSLGPGGSPNCSFWSSLSRARPGLLPQQGSSEAQAVGGKGEGKEKRQRKVALRHSMAGGSPQRTSDTPIQAPNVVPAIFTPWPRLA